MLITTGKQLITASGRNEVRHVNRSLLTALILAAAIACYFAGMVVPATGLLILGGVLELLFWFRLFRRKQQ